MGLSWSEIAVILLVVLLLFGSKRIPELARALGKASYEFKKAKQSIMQESEDLMRDAEKSAAIEDTAAEKKNDKGQG
jgi:sec-independent protein translocase protein TatA